MPTELPTRRPVTSPEPGRADDLVVIVGVLLMLVVSAALLLHPAGVEAAIVQTQAT